VQLSTLDDKAWNVYFLRIITTNQCIYRSAPIYVTATDPTETVETYVWDTAQSERYRVRVPKASLHDVTWSFSTNSARMIPDLNQTGYFLQRGGMYERDGRYYPTQEPMLVDDGEGCVMQFDGSNDVAMTWPQLLPLGCWMLDMWINPVDATPSAEQFIFQVEEAFALVLKTNGAVRTWFGDRTTGVHLTGTTALQDGQWHRVSFVYDLNHIYLLLDGEVEDSAVVKGLRERISLNASLGASVPVAAGGGSRTWFLRKNP